MFNREGTVVGSVRYDSGGRMRATRNQPDRFGCGCAVVLGSNLAAGERGKTDRKTREKENNGIISLIIVAHRLFSSSLFPNFQLG